MSDDHAADVYLAERNIPLLLDHLLVRVCDAQPRDPFKFVADLLATEIKLRRGNRSLVPTSKITAVQ